MSTVESRSMESNIMPENQFVCDYDDCNKRYSRSDHLARHKLNHKALQKYRCNEPDCGKKFVRIDVFKKHCLLQHGTGSKNKHNNNKVTKPSNGIRFIMVDEQSIKQESNLEGSNNKTDWINDDDQPEDVTTNEEQYADMPMSDTLNEEVTPPPASAPVPSSNNLNPVNNKPPPPIDNVDFSVEDLVSSNELIQWLFGDIETRTPDLWQQSSNLGFSPNESLENYPDLEEFEHPLTSPEANKKEFDPLILPSPLELDKSALPNFPYTNEQCFIDFSIMESLEDILPSIKFQEAFKLERLQRYLVSYWKYFHPQFPVLNFPSFSTKRSHPILLLSMLTIGSYISNTTESSDKAIIFSDSIAVPLRWAIYKSKEFKPPPKLWIVQSLVLLECYEICCSSRDLHERANLHRGLSIQMLKRSPMFGGNPWVKYSTTSADMDNRTISNFSKREQWEEWIRDESMKRCALAMFYLETLHAVVFGHDMIIDLHDVKPNLPCNEEFWRSGKYTPKCLDTPLTLLAAIKSILHKKSVKTRGFGRKIILSGLIALSFEVKDRESEFSIPEINSIQQLWKRNIHEAFKFWDLNCAKSNNNNRYWIDSYSIPLRALYESYTQMRHYDFMVYAGAPGRMNVNFNEKELESVTARVVDWCSGLQGKRAVVFIYSYFCSLLFNDQKSLSYTPKADRCFYRKQMISHMLIILWCYNFCKCGRENILLNLNGTQTPSKEEGHLYLQRIKHELFMLTGQEFTHEEVFSDADIFAEAIDKVSDKQNIVGLLRIFQEVYSSDTSEIAREHSRLLANCINRSLGSSDVFCANMFE